MTREEAINELTEALMEINPNDLGREEILRWAVSLNMAIEALKGERPHGEWIKDFNMNKATVCSECGEEAWYKEYCGWVTKSNFCPNCGADMRKEGEE